VTQKVILAETGTAETIDDATVAECSRSRKSRKLNLIREEPLAKWESGFVLSLFFVSTLSMPFPQHQSFGGLMVLPLSQLTIIPIGIRKIRVQ